MVNKCVRKTRMTGKGWDNKIHKVFRDGRIYYITNVGTSSYDKGQKWKVPKSKVKFSKC